VRHRATRLAEIALVVAVLAAPALAQITLPPPTGFVDDFAGVVDPQSRERMETMARNFRDRAGVDVAVVTLTSLEGRSIEEVGLQIGREWKVGAGQDANGIVVLLAVNDRRSRIEVSRHLEGDVTDIASDSILRKARPSFAAGQYGPGLQIVLESVLATIAEARGISVEGIDQQQAYRPEAPRRTPQSSWASRIMFLVVLLIVIAAFARGGGGGYGGRRRRGLSPWILPGVFWGGGGWGGRGGGWGGGSWGGGGGGGWGGFGGGGDFGGGGSSDSW
jgi:uncharacterized protein